MRKLNLCSEIAVSNATGVIRLGKILTLWQNFKNVLQGLTGLLAVDKILYLLSKKYTIGQSFIVENGQI